MHEMSIVEALLEAVQRESRVHSDARVLAVHVRVGRLRQVIPDDATVLLPSRHARHAAAVFIALRVVPALITAALTYKFQRTPAFSAR